MRRKKTLTKQRLSFGVILISLVIGSLIATIYSQYIVSRIQSNSLPTHVSPSDSIIDSNNLITNVISRFSGIYSTTISTYLSKRIVTSISSETTEIIISPHNIIYTTGVNFTVSSAPTPVLVSVAYPDSIEIGEWATITITATNDGGTAEWQTIHCGFPDNPPLENIEIVNHDLNGGAKIYPPGTLLPANYGEYNIPSTYVMVEGVHGPWSNQETHTMTVRVKPENTGTFTFYVKTVSRAEGVTYYDPTPGTKDQQDEYVYVYEINVQTTQTKIEVTISSDRDVLKYEKNKVKITVNVTNTGGYVARDVSVSVEIPYNFETEDSNSWIGDIQPGEQISLILNTNVTRCLPGTFNVTGSYKDDDNIVNIGPVEKTINAEDWIILMDEEGWTDINVSPKTFNKVKSLVGAEDTIAALWLVTTASDLGLDDPTIETLLEHASSFLDWLAEFIKSGEVDQDTLIVLLDIVTSVGINTIRIYMAANEIGKTKIYEDGTMDYHAVWVFEGLYMILERVIESYIAAIEIGISKMDSSLFCLTDTQGQLYLHVYGPSGEEIPVYYGNNSAVTFLPLDIQDFVFVINATDAYELVEEYDLAYIRVEDGNATNGMVFSDTIKKGESQEFEIKLDANGIVEYTTRTFYPEWDGKIYPVTILSNATITNFNFNQTLKKIGLNVTSDSSGFCNVTIPKELLKENVTSSWKVKLNGTDIPFTSTDNATHSFIYFNVMYVGMYKIEIIGAEVIPEFPMWIMLSILMIFTLLTIVLRKKRKQT